MSARLLSITFTPRSQVGWTLPVITFDRSLTVLLGPNGSGKTPILTGVVFALGHPVVFPPDILAHCTSAKLTLTESGAETVIERILGPGLDVRVTDYAGNKQTFSTEKDYSAWLIEKLGIPERLLATKQITSDSGSGVTPAYMSVLLPMFWVDQDLGWRNLYSPLTTHNFIRDQPAEILRWVLGVPPKHRAVDKSSFASAKERVESIHEQIAIRRKTVESLSRELGVDIRPGGRDNLLAQRERLIADLRTSTSVVEVFSQTTTLLDQRIGDAARERDSARFAYRASERRVSELLKLQRDLEAEVEILETNEVAADAFRTLCGNDNCQFFRRPEESYGRRLLYLKDQLKDFQSSYSAVQTDLEGLRSALAEAEAQLVRRVAERQAALNESGAGNIVPSIDRITKELSDVNLRLERLDRFESEQKRFNSIIDLSLREEENLNQLRPTGGGRTDATRLEEVRGELSRSFVRWLEILRTQNIPQEVSFDEDLELQLGGQRFTENSPYRGSTRTRIVLAFHAAVVETSLRTNGNHPGFLILDTPRQHELHSEDLSAFIQNFQQMCVDYPEPVQLIVAATNEDFVPGTLNGKLWRPQFGTADAPRFFGEPER